MSGFCVCWEERCEKEGWNGRRVLVLGEIGFRVVLLFAVESISGVFIFRREWFFFMVLDSFLYGWTSISDVSCVERWRWVVRLFVELGEF